MLRKTRATTSVNKSSAHKSRAAFRFIQLERPLPHVQDDFTEGLNSLHQPNRRRIGVRVVSISHPTAIALYFAPAVGLLLRGLALHCVHPCLAQRQKCPPSTSVLLETLKQDSPWQNDRTGRFVGTLKAAIQQRLLWCAARQQKRWRNDLFVVMLAMLAH